MSRIDNVGISQLPDGEPNKNQTPEGGEAFVSGSQFRLIVQTFLENKLAVVGLGLVVVAVVFCFIGPLLYHTNQVNTSYNINQPPGNGHPLGTDQNGYDVLGRLMLGGQSSLEIGFSVAIIATTFGVAWGPYLVLSVDLSIRL